MHNRALCLFRREARLGFSVMRATKVPRAVRKSKLRPTCEPLPAPRPPTVPLTRASHVAEPRVPSPPRDHCKVAFSGEPAA